MFKGRFGICGSDQGAETLENTEAASERISPYVFSAKGHMILTLTKKGHCSVSQLKHKWDYAALHVFEYYCNDIAFLGGCYRHSSFSSMWSKRLSSLKTKQNKTFPGPQDTSPLPPQKPETAHLLLSVVTIEFCDRVDAMLDTLRRRATGRSYYPFYTPRIKGDFREKKTAAKNNRALLSCGVSRSSCHGSQTD